MVIKTLATLGRISNLPTVWTNILAATIVAQSTNFPQASPVYPDVSQIVILLLALSSMYVGGMFLNDAFDSNWDKINNNMRPIVQGEISRRTVWVIGCGLLLLGLYLVISQNNKQASIAILVLFAAIVLYNAFHKKNPSAAFLMGLTRFCVYIISAMLLAEINTALLIIASALALYISGVTYLARYEQFNKSTLSWPLVLLSMPIFVTIGDSYTIPLYWLLAIIYSVWVITTINTKIFATKPDVRAGIGGLLAAIPLIDGLYLASVNAWIPSIICIIVFLLVPRLHKYVSGT